MRIHFLLATIAASQLGATDCGQVLRDPGFDLWCGDKLCTWKIVRGDAMRVDTWHEGDSGVELVGDDAAIAQLSPVNHLDGTCIRFDLVANVDERAEAFLNIDVYGDGSIDRAERIPTSKWKALSFLLRFGPPYTGVRFELAKRGPGKAVLANISAEVRPAAECDGLSMIDIGPAPLGAICSVDDDCRSGMCRATSAPGTWLGVAKLCTTCDPQAPSCGEGQVCGLGEPTLPTLFAPTTCVAAASDELGEQCGSNAECASGICNRNACSACRDACANGTACALAWPNGPHVCSAGARGAPCARDEDCASGACNGAVREACSDNRPCGNDTNCPVEDGLVPGTCSAVGIQGGSCA